MALSMFSQRSSNLALIMVETASVGVCFGQLWIQFDGLVTVAQRLLKLAHITVHVAPVGVCGGIFWVEFDGPVQCLSALSQARPSHGARYPC